MKRFFIGLGIILAAGSAGCRGAGREGDARGHSAPTDVTAASNRAVLDRLPLSDRQDFEDARRGLVASDAELRVLGDDGQTIWDPSAFDFVAGPAPASVNPSLWRQAKLNGVHGLFEVVDGVYQLRGFDLSNMSIVVGERGWIVVDPLTARETAAAAIAFARRHLDEKPIVAVIFTHSHVDHFGGVLGVLPAEEAERRGVRIIAPAGFLTEATSENVLAGIAMARRATFMFGRNLERSARGHVDTGLGKGPAFGRVAILAPTDVVDRTGQEMVVDGVRFVFQNVPGSEAPAELTFYLPEKKVFCGAELVSHNMHNLYTLRGAKVRDALRWSGYIDEALELFGDAEVYFGSHHWPIWGNERVVDFLERQSDTYRYLHDQTLRLANSGYTPDEIAERLEMPERLRATFSSRGYYGTVRHNAKAVYQRYFGWFDGNPAHLDPLPPVEAGKRYVELMGGAARVLEKARASFDAGEYRWVAELLNHLVFGQPDNDEAKRLLARTYDQLGYRAESGPWRDVYLTGATELRHGPPREGMNLALAKGLLAQTPPALFFDAMATRLNGPEADGRDLTVNVVLTDLGESHVLRLRNAVLHHRASAPDPDADATVELTHDLFLRILTGQAGIRDMLFSDDLEVEGSVLDLLRFFSLFEKPDGRFAIVTP